MQSWDSCLIKVSHCFAIDAKCQIRRRPLYFVQVKTPMILNFVKRLPRISHVFVHLCPKRIVVSREIMNTDPFIPYTSVVGIIMIVLIIMERIKVERWACAFGFWIPDCGWEATILESLFWVNLSANVGFLSWGDGSDREHDCCCKLLHVWFFVSVVYFWLILIDFDCYL